MNIDIDIEFDPIFGQCLVLYQPRVIKGRVANEAAKDKGGKERWLFGNRRPSQREDKEGYHTSMVTGSTTEGPERGLVSEPWPERGEERAGGTSAPCVALSDDNCWSEGPYMGGTNDGLYQRWSWYSIDRLTEQMAWDTTT